MSLLDSYKDELDRLNRKLQETSALYSRNRRPEAHIEIARMEQDLLSQITTIREKYDNELKTNEDLLMQQSRGEIQNAGTNTILSVTSQEQALAGVTKGINPLFLLAGALILGVLVLK